MSSAGPGRGESANAPPRPRLPVRLRSWWRRYWWSILAGALVAAFVLAFAGADGGFLNRLTTALALLPVGVAAPEGDPSVEVRIARVLAPIVFAYATYKALFVLFAERLQDVRASLMKGHTVVCGLGNRGQAFVESLLGSSKIVALERDPANPAVRRLRDAGAVVLVGDSTDPDLLRRAQATRAKHLVSMCGDDAVNAQVAANVLELEREQGVGPAVTFVHVGDPRLYTFLLHHSFASSDARLEFFNVYERSARSLLRKTEAARVGNRPLLVAGLGQFGLALVSQLARERYDALDENPEGGKLRIYLVDREAEARARLLSERYSRLDDACELEPVSIDVQSPAFDHLLEQGPGAAEIAIAFVCFDSDSLTVASSLNLLSQARGRFPVAARVTRRGEGIAGLIQDTHSPYAAAETFLPVSLAERACQAELVLDGMRGQLARAVHAHWQLARDVHEQYRAAGPAVGAAYDVPWEELSDEGRGRNLAHACAIAEQLEQVGYRLGPLVDWGEPPAELGGEEVERMAEIEHERWMRERLEQGWRWGPARSDDPRQLRHPDLVPWAELPEQQREINRRLVRQRPAMLARVGIQIYRGGPVAEPLAAAAV